MPKHKGKGAGANANRSAKPTPRGLNQRPNAASRPAPDPALEAVGIVPATPPKHPGGRPSKLTPEIQAKIVQAIRSGGYIETAAAYAGINKTTLYDWLKTGARDLADEHDESRWESEHAQFTNAVEKALADAELADVSMIGKHGLESWQALAWRLERKHPDRYGRRIQEMPGGEGEEKAPDRKPQYFMIGGQLLEV